MDCEADSIMAKIDTTPFSSPLDSGIGHDKYLIFFYRPHFILAFLTGAGLELIRLRFMRLILSQRIFRSQSLLGCFLQYER
jgi:hypothetical protein